MALNDVTDKYSEPCEEVSERQAHHQLTHRGGAQLIVQLKFQYIFGYWFRFVIATECVWFVKKH